MKTTKKLMLALSLLVASSSVVPSANAGIMMLAGSFGNMNGGATTAGIILIILGGPAGIVIDNNSISDQLTKQLLNKYPGLASDMETTQSYIQNVLMPEYNRVKSESSSTFVVVNENITREHFAHSIVDASTVNALATDVALLQ